MFFRSLAQLLCFFFALFMEILTMDRDEIALVLLGFAVIFAVVSVLAALAASQGRYSL